MPAARLRLGEIAEFFAEPWGIPKARPFLLHIRYTLVMGG